MPGLTICTCRGGVGQGGVQTCHNRVRMAGPGVWEKETATHIVPGIHHLACRGQVGHSETSDLDKQGGYAKGVQVKGSRGGGGGAGGQSYMYM